MGGLLIRWKIRGVAVFLMWFALVSGNEDERLELPFCNPEKPNSVDTRIRPVFVSTLDGTFSSLNAVDGSSLWNINTGPGPLLSSSIHQLELSNDAEWVRLIPSLTGGLYKFNKKHIEAIPISADKLLEPSPFLFSDDLHIAGGKEIRTYGVDIGSGTVLYECSMSGCINRTNGLYYNQDVLVVHRYTQTVRAVHARSGVERWNFSVGQHDLNFMTDRNVGCKNEVEQQNTDNFEIKAVIPDGVICAVNKLNPNEIIWKYKFQAPIASAWILEDGKFQSIDLFSGTLKDENNGYITPSLYIGMHKKQLYIQESSITQRDVVHMTNFLTEESNYPRIPWNPIPASDNHLGIDGPLPKEDSTAIQVFDASTTANSVLYASEYVNGYGFFLQSKVDQLLDCSNSDDGNSTITTEDNTDEQETPVEIIIVSLWYWWKEVVIISITTALLVNLFTQRFMHSWQIRDRQDVRKEIIFVEKCVVAKPENDSGVVLPIQNSLAENNQVNSTCNFMSRYLNDFDPVQCLGRGGFGVVFEAKNKIDECSYAVKRIALPNNKESRERVMREVKALAKLDHQHIVRYFNAWVEFPPPGWQEIQDNNIFKGFKDSTTVDLSELSKGYTSDVSKSEADKIYNSGSLHHSDPEVSDSFIVFDASQHSSKCSPRENSSAYLDIVKSKFGDSHSVIDKYSHASLNNNYNENGELAKRPSFLNVQNDFSYLPPVSSTVYLYIQMQLCHRESLREWLRDNVISRDTQRVLQMFEQIVQAVEYVHLQGLIHRDLKPSNIFFSLNGQVKVGDFGLVTAMVEDVVDQRTPSSEKKFNPEDKHTAQVGTETYMSPEQLKGLPYDYKVDIYSLGLILFELLVPFSTQMERHKTLTDLRNNKFPADFQKKFKDEFELLKLMLSHSPDQRPTTYGIRARPPLNLTNSTEDYEWHFELPSRKRAPSQSASFSNSSSVESWENIPVFV